MNEQELNQLYITINSLTGSEKQEKIDGLTLEQYIGYLRYTYDNKNISCEETANGLYIIKNGEAGIIQFEKGANLGEVNKQIEENNSVVRNLQNKGIYEEVDVNKLNTINNLPTNSTNYNINVDVELFNTIIKKYKNIFDNLNKWKSFAKTSMLKGKLKEYYDGFDESYNLEKIIEEMILDFDEIILKTEMSIKTYVNIDEKLRWSLDTIFNEIFNMDNTEMYALETIDERRAYLQTMIQNCSATLERLKEEYKELLQISEGDIGKVFNLFDSLCFVVDEDVIYDRENESYRNLNELAKLLDKIEEENIKEVLNNYFVKDMSWEKSGMEKSFGDKIITFYQHQTNRNDNQDAEAIFFQNYMSCLKKSSIGKEDAGEYGKFMLHVYLYGEYCNEKYDFKDVDWDEQLDDTYEKYFYLKDQGNVLEWYDGKTYDEYYNEWRDSQKKEYEDNIAYYSSIGIDSFDEYLIKSDTQTINSIRNVIESNFNEIYNGHRGYGSYYEMKEELYKNDDDLYANEGYENLLCSNKETIGRMIKSYVAYSGGLNTLDQIEDDLEKATAVQKDILILENNLYNLKQYYKLMPFELERTTEEYITKYYTKMYSEDDFKYLADNVNGLRKFLTGEKTEILSKDWLNYLDISEVAMIDYLYHEKDILEVEKYLEAMQDTINQRKGYSNALKYIENLNEEDRATILSTYKTSLVGGPVTAIYSLAASCILPDVYDFFTDMSTAMLEGVGDGVENFFNGFVNLVTADGIRSANDYENYYKLQLLTEDNEYNKNLTPFDRWLLSGVYQVGSSVGNMIIPSLVSYVPVVGTVLSPALLLASSTGNNTENLMQQGVSKADAYLYGFAMGLSETAIEMLSGGIPGSKGASRGFVKSLFGEASEEFIQTYVSAGIESCATGKPVDLTEVTGEAFKAATMAIFSTAILTGGKSVFIKIADTIVEVSPSKYNSYQEWANSIETEFRNSHPTLAKALFVGSNNVNNDTIEHLDIAKEDMPNLSTEQKNLISSMNYNTKTGTYEVNLINGKTFTTNNISNLTGSQLLAYLGVNNVVAQTNTQINAPGELQVNTQVDEQSSNVLKNISIPNLSDSIRTMSGFLSGLTTNLSQFSLKSITDALNSFRLEIKNKKYLYIPLSEIDFTNMNSEDIIYILNNNTLKGEISDSSKSYFYELAKTDIKMAEFYMDEGGDLDFLITANKEVLLAVLETAYKDFIYDGVPDLALTDPKVAEICINNQHLEFLFNANENVLKEFLSKAYKIGYRWFPKLASTNTEIAQICMDNGIYDFLLIAEENVLKEFLSKAYENGYRRYPSLAQTNTEIAQICMDNGIYDFLFNADENVLKKFLSKAYENGYRGLPSLASTNTEIAKICMDFANNNVEIAESFFIKGYYDVSYMQLLSKDVLMAILPKYYEKNPSSNIIPTLAFVDDGVMAIVRECRPSIVVNETVSQKISETMNWIHDGDGLAKSIRDYFGFTSNNEGNIDNAIKSVFVEEKEMFKTYLLARDITTIVGYNERLLNTSHVLVDENSVDLIPTATHEAIHSATRDSSTGVSGLKISPTYNGINEAATELFTQEIVGDQYTHPNYCAYYIATTQLKTLLEMGIPGLDFESFKHAYVTHDVDSIKRSIDSLSGEGYFETRVLPAFNKSTAPNIRQHNDLIDVVTELGSYMSN